MSKTNIDDEPCYGGCGRPGEDELHPCPVEVAIAGRCDPSYCNCCKSCHNDCEGEARYIRAANKGKIKH